MLDRYNSQTGCMEIITDKIMSYYKIWTNILSCLPVNGVMIFKQKLFFLCVVYIRLLLIWIDKTILTLILINFK